MRFEEVIDQLSGDAELFTKNGEYIGFCSPSGSFAIAIDEGFPAPEVDDVLAAEVVDCFIDEEGNDTFIVDLG